MNELAELLNRVADAAPVPHEQLVGEALRRAEKRSHRRRAVQVTSVGVLAAVLLLGTTAFFARGDVAGSDKPAQPADQPATVDVAALQRSTLVTLVPTTRVPRITSGAAIKVAVQGLPKAAQSATGQVPGAELFEVTSHGVADRQDLPRYSTRPGRQVKDRLSWVVAVPVGGAHQTAARQDYQLYVFVDAITGGRMFGIADNARGATDLSEDAGTLPPQLPLNPQEISLATRVAKTEQANVSGTFVGATAFPAWGARFPDSSCDPAKRYLTIRLVWESDANFVHSHAIGSPPDGPRKAQVITIDPGTGAECGGFASYRDVGAGVNETLLYGSWPDLADS